MSKNLSLNIDIYKSLYLIRRVEERIRDLYFEDEMKTPMHMSMGGEAIAVGICQAAGSNSQMFGTYRSHALYLTKTMETDEFFAEMYGKATGVARGKAGSMHLSQPDQGLMMTSAVVGTNIPGAVGAALANKYLNNKKIVVSFFGDGAIHEGVFWESLNFACLKKLPILFVCEDNDLAIHSRLKERAGHGSITEIVSGFNCHIDKAETTDVYKIYQITKKIMDKMRKTGLPGFLHFKYYRYLEHVGVQEDFNAGYRSKKELLPWLKTDPVKLQRNRILRSGIEEKKITLLEKEIDKQIEESIDKAKRAPFPKKSEVFSDTYA